MKGFIVASVNEKAIKQAGGLESQVIRYTPAMAPTQEDVIRQYQKAFPDHIIIMTIPMDVMKKNIQVLEDLARQKEIVLVD